MNDDHERTERNALIAMGIRERQLVGHLATWAESIPLDDLRSYLLVGHRYDERTARVVGLFQAGAAARSAADAQHNALLALGIREGKLSPELVPWALTMPVEALREFIAIAPRCDFFDLRAGLFMTSGKAARA